MNDLTQYHNVRHMMHTWDLLTYETHGVISTLIHIWSKANHAGAVLHLPEYEGEEHRRWTLEAVGAGVRLAYLSEILAHVNGRVYWHPLKPEFHQFRHAAGYWALEKAGCTKYDFRALLQMMFGLVSADAAKLICSEYYFFGAKVSGMVQGDYIPSPSGLPELGITLPPVLIVDSGPVVPHPPVQP